jgi:putative phosphonate metabolism protein
MLNMNTKDGEGRQFCGISRMDVKDSRRYAIYYSPEEGSLLEQFGARWIGRSAFTAKDIRQDECQGIAPQKLTEITKLPRHYGFHGTLKPPFHLINGTTVDELFAAAEEFAANQPAIACPGLVLTRLGRFLALTPSTPCKAINRLAHKSVGHFDEFRLPPSDAEISERLRKGLTYRQELHLMRWGYPYVFRDYTFHLSLTGQIADQREMTVLQNILTPLVEQFTDHLLVVNALYIFSQPDRSTPFTVMERFALRG